MNFKDVKEKYPTSKIWHLRIKPGESFTDSKYGVVYVNENKHICARIMIVREDRPSELDQKKESI